MSKARIAIIGAGPAGLAAAERLLRLGYINVEIFESGRKRKARICPVDHASICDGCSGSCNVVSGVGGCIQPEDSIKLSMFPSGRRLLNHIGAENSLIAKELAMSFFGVKRNQFLTEETQKFGDLELRHYPIHEIDPVGVGKLHLKFEEITRQVDRFHKRAKVNKISRTSKKFSIHLNGGTSVKDGFDNVLIATGRSGYSSILDNSDEIEVLTTPPKLSIGLRLELPAKMLVSMFKVHKDFKFSKVYGNEKVKSFCFSSAGLMGGRLKFCHYPDQFDFPATLLDGHANYGTDLVTIPHPEAYGNIGLLVQLPNSFDTSWLNKDFLRRYHSLSNGKPIMQSLEMFTTREIAGLSIDASVADVTNGRLDSLFSEAHHSALVNATYDVLRGISSHSDYTMPELISSTNCIGPEVEFFWPTIDASQHFQTNVPGLYMAGDSLGIAQGNFQAAVSGIVAAKGIEEGESQYFPNRKSHVA